MQGRTSSPLTPAVMVHFYRGIMDLTVTWRSRVDGTTNWAVVTAGSIASFLLSDPERTHLMALLGMFLTFAFLVIEARRFRFYDLWSGWLRLIETEYFAQVLRQNSIAAHEQWHPILVADLQHPHFKISWSESMGRRLRHNYAAIFVFMLLLWLMKLMPAPNPRPDECATLLQCAAVGPIAGGFVLSAVGLLYAYLIGLVVFTPKLIGTGIELIDRPLNFRRMVAPGATPVGFKSPRRTTFIVDSAAGPPEED